MDSAVPMIISAYMDASVGGDVDAIVRCFNADAVVVDEDQEWRGVSRIREWRERVATAYEYTVEVRGAFARGDVDGLERYEVYTHLAGNFPGGTVDLSNRFGLRDGLISHLQIVPTEATEA